MSCLKSYKPIYNENNKILSCEYNKQNENKNISTNESYNIIIAYNESIIDESTNIIEKYDIITERNINNTYENLELISENITINNSLEIKSELIAQSNINTITSNISKALTTAIYDSENMLVNNSINSINYNYNNSTNSTYINS